MNSNWKECKLGACLERVIDNRGKTPPLANNATPYGLIEVNALTGSSKLPNYRAIHKYVSEETYETWFRSGHPKTGDVLFATVGTIAETAILNEDRGSIAQNLIALRPINEALASDFLYYHFITPSTKQMLMSLDISSVQPSIKVPHLLDTDILLPPLPEQRAIVGVLSGLDEKVDLLHRQNKTLEGMAEALWRKMFVEEAGSGWETTTIGEVATINGKSIDKEYTFAEIEYLDTGSLTEGRISEYQYLQLKDAPSRARRIVQKNDIVISMVRPIQKHYGILKKVNHNTIVSTGFVVITCIEIDPHFIYVLLTQKEMTEYLDIIAEASTTTYPSLVPSDIAKIDFQIPPTELMRQFSEYAEHAWHKIEENNSQMRTLFRLRDTLLPKLMNGEVRVTA